MGFTIDYEMYKFEFVGTSINRDLSECYNALLAATGIIGVM